MFLVVDVVWNYEVGLGDVVELLFNKVGFGECGV